MGFYDFIAGTDSKLAEAELLYNEGLYEEALEKIELDNVQNENKPPKKEIHELKNEIKEFKELFKKN